MSAARGRPETHAAATRPGRVTRRRVDRLQVNRPKGGSPAEERGFVEWRQGRLVTTFSAHMTS